MEKKASLCLNKKAGNKILRKQTITGTPCFHNRGAPKELCFKSRVKDQNMCPVKEEVRILRKLDAHSPIRKKLCFLKI
jgi:hypothetical protein